MYGMGHVGDRFEISANVLFKLNAKSGKRKANGKMIAFSSTDMSAETAWFIFER